MKSVVQSIASTLDIPAAFLEHFKDEETCRAYFAGIRFRNGEYCPHCGHREIYKFANGKRYRCASCKEDFTIITGSVFGESKVPLRKWFIAIYLLSATSKGISSPEFDLENAHYIILSPAKGVGRWS